MRVIAGIAKSLRLIAPKGQDVRPTQDRHKETLFNMLSNKIFNCTFLDIFSGSGGVGIEAISRGAKEVYFIEKNGDALSCISNNLKHTKLLDRANIISLDYKTAIKRLKEKSIKFDIIFFDPPYNRNYEEEVLSLLFSSEILAEDGIIICESSLNTSFQFMNAFPEYDILKEKPFKTNKFTFIRQNKLPDEKEIL